MIDRTGVREPDVVELVGDPLAIEPAPPSTMFSCAPPSIENSVLMLPCPRTRSSRWRNDTFDEVGGEEPAHRRLEEVAGDLRADAGALELRC